MVFYLNWHQKSVGMGGGREKGCVLNFQTATHRFPQIHFGLNISEKQLSSQTTDYQMIRWSLRGSRDTFLPIVICSSSLYRAHESGRQPLQQRHPDFQSQIHRSYLFPPVLSYNSIFHCSKHYI